MGDRTDRVRDDIAEFGWHVIMVPADDEGPSFAYSIGLFRTYGHPEVIVFGLPLATMHSILNTIGEEVRRGRRFDAGDRSDEILEGQPVAFGAIAAAHYDEYLGQAIRHYGGAVFPAIQCFWPTPAGLWPWQEGCPTGYVAAQPLLQPPGPQSH